MIYVEKSESFADMQTMGERLRAAREAANYSSATKAAESLGVSVSTYRAHENGQNDFAPDVAEQYARKFGTSAAYLMTGEGPARTNRTGPRLVPSYDPDVVETEQAEAGGAAYSREHWTPRIDGAIPEIDVKLGAGEGTVGEVINLPVGGGAVSGHRVVAEWLIPADYLRNELKASLKDTLIEEVVGDSMFPTYSPGDRVIIDLTQNRLTTDTVYSISDGIGEPQIKRLQRVPFTDPPEVNIISDNPNLETFRVELDRVHIIGRICGHLSRR
ncbi:MAG: hypothetical protein JWQ74_3547 [Marmoricola sp.]|nr:hypothetical protein [Marmoricola sp.]